MVSFSRCFSSALLALLVASLFDSTSAIVFNYTSYFTPTRGCSLTVDLSGNIFVGLCSQQTIVKLSSAFVADTTYNGAVKNTLLPYTTNSNNILQLAQMGVSSTGTLWFIDSYNLRILGVDSTAGTSVSTIDLSSVGGALALGVSVYSANIWVSVPAAASGTVATVRQYDPTGNVLKTIGSSTDATNLPSTYFIMGVMPDPTNTLVYVGGCVVATANSLIYEPGSGFEYASAGGFYPCDVRAVSQSTGQVVQTFTAPGSSQAIHFFRRFMVRAGSSDNSMFPAGTVYADDSYTGIVYAFSNSTGAVLANITGISSAPAFTPQNNFVYLGPQGLSVRQYNPGTTPNTIYSISNVTFGNPEWVAIAPSGSPVYVASGSGGPVAVMSTDNPPVITGYIGGTTLQYPDAMAVDNSGNLFVIDGQTNIVYKYSSAGTQLLTFSDASSSIGAGICIDNNNGNIYVPADNITATDGSGWVLVFSSAGTLTKVIGQTIPYPWACAVLSSGMVVVDAANEPGAIYFLDPNTGNSTFFTDAALGQDFETLGMAVANDGRIFVAALNLGIYVFSSTGQYIDVISSPAADIEAYSMAYTTSGGGLLYVADIFNQRVVTFKVGTSGPGSSDSSRTVSGLATTAALTIAALIFTLFISA